MLTTIRNYIIGTLVFLLLACIQYTVRARRQLRAAWENERTLALRVNNAEALKDTTRDLSHGNAGVARILGDSLNARGRRVVQRPQVIDAIDSALESQRAARYAMSVVVDSLRASIPLTARIQCSLAADAGVRSASIAVTAPPWAKVRFGEVEQDPGICSNPSRPPAERSRRLLSWSPIALSVGRQLGRGNTGWSAQIGTALLIGGR